MLRSFVRPTGKWVRDRLLDAAFAIERLGDGDTGVTNAPDPLQLTKTRTVQQILTTLRRNPAQLLQCQYAREVIAAERSKALMHHASVARVGQTANIVTNAIDYNIQGAITAAGFDRPSIMVNVVRSIERVWKNISRLDVLSIGPRSEIEIFAIIGAGFDPARVKALDLFSYSPYVDAGDMHCMPYADCSFDIVFAGWVLPYSRNQRAAAQEMLRVCRDRAIVVLACDYGDEEKRDRAVLPDATLLQNSDQLLSLFAGHISKIFFRHEPEQPEISTIMAAFEISKPAVVAAGSSRGSAESLIGAR